MTETLDSYSLIAVYSAMSVYAIAFILFTLDLARRSAAATQRQDAVVAQQSAGGTTTATLEPTATDAKPMPKYVNAALALTIIAWVLHLGADVLRGIAAARVPWGNMYEFALTSTLIVVGVFLVAQLWQDLRFLGAYITGFIVLTLGVATVNFYVEVVPLQDALGRSPYWLVIHVMVAILGVGFFALSAALSVVQLLRQRRDAGGLARARYLDTVPSVDRLETSAYAVAVIGFVFWTFTLVAGAIWANEAWGRPWGWDTKEVWTFIIWVLYAGYIHARATRGWRGTRSAWLAIVGFAAVVFNFSIVNVFFKGLHSYSGL